MHFSESWTRSTRPACPRCSASCSRSTFDSVSPRRPVSAPPTTNCSRSFAPCAISSSPKTTPRWRSELRSPASRVGAGILLGHGSQRDPGEEAADTGQGNRRQVTILMSFSTFASQICVCSLISFCRLTGRSSGHVERRPIESTAVIACARSSRTGAGGFSGDRAGLLSRERPHRRLLRAGDRVQFAADGLGRGRGLGNRSGHGAAAEIRRGRVCRGDLRIQLGPGGYCHVLLLPPERDKRRDADRGLCGGGSRDPADAAPPAVSNLHHTIHRHDVGLLTSWVWPWAPPAWSRGSR